MIELLVATTNPHKLDEIGAELRRLGGARAIGLSDVQRPDGRAGSDLPEPDETGETFEENARIKASEYARALSRPCLADDSGLEVDALSGEPGVRSARYAGAEGTREQRDRANIEKLLDALRDVPREHRAARFVCAMCLVDPSGNVLAAARGTLDGIIAEAPRGEHGFGYDPLLEIPDGRTVAELTQAEKNALSHRGAAARAIAPQLAKALRAEAT